MPHKSMISILRTSPSTIGHDLPNKSFKADDFYAIKKYHETIGYTIITNNSQDIVEIVELTLFEENKGFGYGRLVSKNIMNEVK